MAHCCNVSDLRFLWIDNDAGNGAAIFQADVLPILTAIDRSINAVAPIGRIAVVRFASSDPDDIGIGRRNDDRAKGESWVLVHDRVKPNALIVCLENAAVSKSDIKDKWVARINRYIRDATAHHRWPDRARFQIFEKDVGKLWRGWRWSRRYRRIQWRSIGGRRHWRSATGR